MTSAEDTLEFWVEKFKQEGRFEASAEIVSLVQRTRDLALLREWLGTVATGSEAEVIAMFRAARAT